MIATISSACLLGVDGHPVAVEVHVSNGLPGFTIVGLPDAACREARDRVRAALLSSGLKWSPKRVTVNLAPSGLRKVGAGLDLAIAVGFLIACEQLPADAADGAAFFGELGLDGSVRAIDGLVPLVDATSEPAVVVPAESAGQAALVGRHDVRAVSSLSELVSTLMGKTPWAPAARCAVATVPTEPDLADVRGQPLARWAIEVAAAGGHNVLLNGPPGSGKTMLARRLPGVLPDLDSKTALEATKVHSAAGLLGPECSLIRRPPFRAPHHTSSMVSMIGGGAATMRPGEVSLSHGGVLFLDEMAEFPPSVLDTLRQPLEEGVARVSRARASVVFPASFMCVAATNPCPCGEGITESRCGCPPAARARYRARLSGPLRDRFDIRVNVLRPKVDEFFDRGREEASAVVANRVAMARERAVARSGRLNAHLSAEELEHHAPLSSDASTLLRHKMRIGALSARGLFRVRRVALTLADLEGSAVLYDRHVCAALELRSADDQMERAS